MCNSDITVEILEKAIEDVNSKKGASKFLGGIFSRSQQSPAVVVQPPANIIRQELPPSQLNPSDSLRVRDIDS